VLNNAMRRIASHVIVASLTFCVGVSLNRISFRARPSLPLAVARPEGVFAEQPKLERKYQPRVSADGMTNDGYRFGVNGLVSSDGTNYSQMTIYYKSGHRANLELLRALKEAVEVIRREPMRAANGEPLGEKVVARFSAKSEYGPASMLWTDGSTFQYVSTSSLENLLQYERDFYLSER
jgi:hypothetical protein